jgi:uncharacterized damage-inducible protein DinB
MNNAPLPRIDVTPTWARFNEELIKLVDFVPGDRLDWSPKPELWNFRGILLHMASARDIWLERDVQDGVEAPDVYRTVRTRPEIQQALRRTWERLAAFLHDQAKLDATYATPWETNVSGHWIAFHALEHDIHHRADILHYLALLGIETPDVSTP